MIYHPRYLPESTAFEILVHLVLEREHPSARIKRRLPPDWGIDVTREEDNTFHAYQCKHHRQPKASILKRELQHSLTRAIEYRSKLHWRDYTLCTSEDLTGDQIHQCGQIARDLGLTSSEFGIRSGTQFVGTLAKNPWIWEAVTNPEVLRNDRVSHLSLNKPFWVDSRLRNIVTRTLQSESRIRLVDALEEQGMLEVAMNDWYELTAQYYESTKRDLRMIAFDQEIPSFWLTKSGSRYFSINKRLASKGINVRRIYAFDFALAADAPEIFKTMVFYMMQQQEAGIACRAIDRDAFSETLQINCALFGVQDNDNVALFSSDGLWVTVVRDRDFVNDAIEMYDELFASRECIRPVALHTQ